MDTADESNSTILKVVEGILKIFITIRMSRHVFAIILYIWIFVIDLETTVFKSECSYAKAAVHMEDVTSASVL